MQTDYTQLPIDINFRLENTSELNYLSGKSFGLSLVPEMYEVTSHYLEPLLRSPVEFLLSVLDAIDDWGENGEAGITLFLPNHDKYRIYPANGATNILEKQEEIGLTKKTLRGLLKKS